MLSRAAVLRAWFIMVSWLSAPPSELKEDLVPGEWMSAFSGGYWVTLSSVPASWAWVFCDISCLGKKCERCDVAVRACGCSFPIFLWLSRKQVNWFLYPSGNSCQRLKPAWSKLSRRHKCWGGREPEYSCLLLRWLFPACFARKVHAIAVISKHVFAVEHGMDAHLCKAERALFKMSFSCDARNDTLEGSSSCSTGRGS